MSGTSRESLAACSKRGIAPLATSSPSHPLLPPNAWPLLRSILELSTRELQIVQCVFEDNKQEAIAYRLGISTGTVNTYFHRLYTKLHVSSRPQLIVRVMAAYLALTSNWLDPSNAGLAESPEET